MPDLINIPSPVKSNFFIPSGGGFGASRAKQSGSATAVHNGLDMAVTSGTPVYAPLDGIALVLAPNARAGNQMQLVHDGGYTTGYAHLSKIVVNTGDQVKANSIIAYTGDSGDAAGHPHLHFTLKKNGVAVDPYPYLANDTTVANNNSVQYTPESTVVNKKSNYVQVIAVDSKYINTLDSFVAKYNLTLTPSELLNFGNNATNIVNAYTKAQKQANNNQANSNLINVGTLIEVPLNAMKSNNPYRVNQNLLVGLDYRTFIEAEIAKLINDPRYKRLNMVGDDNNASEGMTYKKINQVSIWVWSRSVSPNGSYLVDISPFVKSVSLNVTRDGGNFQIELPHISLVNNQSKSANDPNANAKLSASSTLSPAQTKSDLNLPVINNHRSQSADMNYSSFVIKGNSHTVEKINKGDFQLEPPSKDYDISNDTHFLKRNTSLFNQILQANDVVFIRLEKLEIDSSLYSDTKDGYVIIQSQALEGRVFDMIGLVDITPIQLSGANNRQHVTVAGRDLSKLLLDDGVYYFPVSYEVENSEQIIKNSSKTKSAERLFIPLAPDGNVYYNNLHFNVGNILSDTKFNFDVTQTISDWLLFIFQQLTNIKICPNNLFSSYKDKTFIVSRNNNFAPDGSYGYTRINADGIWQIVKLVTDPNISERRVVDSSLSTDTGSLINLIRKVCQDPFCEFTSDTYGDKFYFIVRKPPYVESSYRTNKIINILDYDIVGDSGLTFEQNFYTWFRLTPMGSIIDTSDANVMMQLPAVLLPEYFDVWGNKIFDIQTNYLDFYYSEAAETQVDINNILEQAQEDLDWLIEANAYLPFSRTGQITIKADRRIKRGMCVRLLGTGEVYHVDAVQNVRTFEATATQATTTLQLSRGLVEKHFDKYFKLVNLRRNGSKNYWTVNNDIFNFFLSKQQFL